MTIVKPKHATVKRENKEFEKWRKTIKLGSMLGDQEDIEHRKNLATAALSKMNKTWVRNHKIGIEKRLKLYNAIVKPVLTYNSLTFPWKPMIYWLELY